MINAEIIAKIKAEIERRKEFHNKVIKSCAELNTISLTHSAGFKEDEEILSFLSTLEESISIIVGATLYESISDILAIGFMDYLNRNRTEGKMCLSGWECDDIMKAFRKQDWERIERYKNKYLLSKND